MAAATMNSILSPLEKLPSLATAVAQFTEEGATFIEKLYTFQSGAVYSPYIATEIPTRGLCCLKFQLAGLNFGSAGGEIGSENQLCSLEAAPLGKAGKHGLPFIFTLNKRVYLIKLNRSLTVTTPKQWKQHPPLELKSLLVPNMEEVYKCWLPRDYLTTSYLGLDEFTNESLIAGLLDRCWKQGLPSESNTSHGYTRSSNFFPYLVHQAAALCGENILLTKAGTPLAAVKTNAALTGLNLMEYCNLGNLEDITLHPEYCYRIRFDEMDHPVFSKDLSSTSLKFQPRAELILAPHLARGILFHVVYALSFFKQKLAFNHGDAKISNVFLHRYAGPSTVEWLVNNLEQKIELPFCAKLADYGKSSASWPSKKGVVRLFWEPESSAVRLFRDTYRKASPFVPEVKGSTYTVRTRSESGTYARLRMMGVPYYKSYDLYMFMTSFFLQPWAFYLLTLYPDFKRASWDQLWLHAPDAGATLYERIRIKLRDAYGSKELQRTGILIKLLRDLPLACDVNQSLLNALALYQHTPLSD